MNWQVSETIGPKRALTNEGFLVCRDVPVARTGPMVYRAGELGAIQAGSTGVIVVHRDPADVFDEKSVQSFEGKPIVVDHPIVNGQVTLLTSDNWRQYAVGSMHNVRRGEGTQDNLLIADLLVTDAGAISEIMSGRREVSCGYNAEYRQLSPGQAQQYDIRGNHLALVRQGRCGVACTIGDSDTMTIEERLAAMRATRAAALKAADDAYEASVVTLVKPATGDNLAMPGMGAQNVGTDPSGRIIVNVHGGAKGATDAPPPPGVAPAAGAPASGVAPAAPAAPGAEVIPAWAQQLIQEVASIKAALFDEGDEGGDGSEEDDTFQTANQSSTGEKPDIGENGEQKTEKKMGAGDQGDLTKAEPSRKVGQPMGKTGTGNGMPTGGGVSGDGKTATGDSASLQTLFQDTISRAEILVPGMTLPKFEVSAAPTVTTDSMCALRRNVLTAAMKDKDTSVLIAPLVDTLKDIATADGASVQMAFMGASELVRAARTRSTFQSNKTYVATADGAGQKKGPSTPAEINARSKELWSKAAA